MLLLEFYSDFRSEKSYKGVYVHGQTLGGIATTLQDLLQPPRHGIHQVSSFTPTEQRREGGETGPYHTLPESRSFRYHTTDFPEISGTLSAYMHLFEGAP